MLKGGWNRCMIPRNIMNEFEIKDGVLQKYNGCEKNIVIPTGITVLEKNCFDGIEGIRTITIPKTVKKINCDFSDYFSLGNVFFDGSISDWCLIDFAQAESNPLLYGANFYILNDNGEYDYTWDVEIPFSITNIKQYTFAGSKISRLTIHENVKKVEQNFIQRCPNLFEIYNLSSCDLSFEYCTIHKKSNEKTVLEILDDEYVFVFDNNLGESSRLLLINYIANEKNVEPPRFIKDGVNYDYEIWCYVFKGKEMTSIRLGNHITGGWQNVFESCCELRNVELSNTMRYIEEAFFAECTELRRIILPESVNYINSYAFSNCIKLEEIDLSEIFEVGSYSFENCVGLTKLILPINLNLKGEAFDGCNNIKEVIYPRSSSQFIVNLKEKMKKKSYNKHKWFYNSSIDIIKCTDADVSIKEIIDSI